MELSLLGKRNLVETHLKNRSKDYLNEVYEPNGNREDRLMSYLFSLTPKLNSNCCFYEGFFIIK